MIELYVFPPSPRAFKVMAVANYLGIEPTLHALDLIKGDQKSLEYAALNPNMLMPTLKDGDYVAVGIKRRHAIPRKQAAGERSAPVRRKGAARRDALAILGPRALGSYLRGISVRKHRQIPRPKAASQTRRRLPR